MFKNMSIRELALWLFVIMIVSFSIAGSIFFHTGGYNFSTFGHQINETLPFSVEKITEININSGSPTVRVIPIDGNQIIVHFYGNANSSSENRYPKLNAEINNNSLVVTVKQPPQTIGINLSNESQDLHLDVSVPKNYTSNIFVKTSSGDATIEGFNLNNLTSDASSGNLYVKSVTAKQCLLRTTSGDTYCEKINSDQFRSEASSGEIKLSDQLSKDSVLKTSSGDIVANRINGNLRADSSSGKISLDYMEFKNNIDVTASSGDVRIHLPKNAEFFLSANSSSGAINNDFPLKISGENKHNHLEGTVGNGVNKINVKTTSGDINLIN